MTSGEDRAAVVPQQEGRVLRAFGEEVTILLDGECTGDKLTAWTEITPPGGGPPPHYHSTDDETFYVLEGRVAFLVDGNWREIAAGGSAFMPRGVVHTFKNVGDERSRLFIMTMPSGFEKFFARCAEEFAKRGGPDMSRIVQIGAEHGIHFLQQ
jgi:mannose-6-phosphate isomerase-like protein (cupin superfamily)